MAVLVLITLLSVARMATSFQITTWAGSGTENSSSVEINKGRAFCRLLTILFIAIPEDMFGFKFQLNFALSCKYQMAKNDRSRPACAKLQIFLRRRRDGALHDVNTIV